MATIHPVSAENRLLYREQEEQFELIIRVALVVSVALAVSVICFSQVYQASQAFVANGGGLPHGTFPTPFALTSILMLGMAPLVVMVVMAQIFKPHAHRIAMGAVEEHVSSLPCRCTLNVKVGDVVEVGTLLYTQEVMKMEVRHFSSARGRVVEILAEDGADLQQGQPILRIQALGNVGRGA